jgi:hypothetical protein
MSMLSKLLGYLNRVFDKNPYQFIAFRLDYQSGVLTWTVADSILTITTSDNLVNLAIPLASYTIAQLVAYIEVAANLTITGIPSDGTQNRSALTLIDGTNNTDALNGDCVYAYTSLLWAYQGACAQELVLCKAAIVSLPLEMSTVSADGVWLDFIGGYYDVVRLANEPDETYGPRIVAEVIQPLSNGPAIAQVVSNTTGQPATVTDVVEYGPAVPEYNDLITYDAAYEYDASAEPIYNLFDLTVGYDIINGADPADFSTIIRAQVNRIRAAGTQLRNLFVASSAIGDTFTPPTDGVATQAVGVEVPGLADTLTAPSDATSPAQVALAALSDTLTPPTDAGDTLVIYTNPIFFNGANSYNGQIPFGETITRDTSTLEGS